MSIPVKRILGALVLGLLSYPLFLWFEHQPSSSYTRPSVIEPRAEPAVPGASSRFERERLEEKRDDPGEGVKRPEVARLQNHSPGLPVGSEGYMPGIRRAFESGTPIEAYEASRRIRFCTNVDRYVMDSINAMNRNTDAKLAAGYLQGVEYIQAEQRACQSVDTATAALREPLLEKAVLGGIWQAAETYFVERKGKISNELRQAGTRAIVSAADTGDLDALRALVTTSSSLAIDSEQLLLYFSALALIQEAAAKNPRDAEHARSLAASLNANAPSDVTKSPLFQARLEELVAKGKQRLRNGS